MPLTVAVLWVLPLMTSEVVPGGKLPGVQPSNRLSCGPTVAPFGPHAVSGMTPWPVAGSNKPSGEMGLSGSVTKRPPLQKGAAVKLQPAGLFAIWGIDV